MPEYNRPQVRTSETTDLPRTEDIGSISQWLDGVKLGASEAQQAIWNRYLQQLLRYADYRLRSLGVRSEADEDIVQQVFAGFFRRAETGQFPDLNDRNDLWRTLVRITNDRVIDARRRKVPLTESALGPEADPSASVPAIAQLEGNQPTPDDCFAMEENMRTLFARLEESNPVLKQIAALRLAGHTVNEIADKLQMSLRTVERRLEWIRKLWIMERPIDEPEVGNTQRLRKHH